MDIQPDQIDGFRARLASDGAVSKVDTAPMLRGIITQINGQPADEATDGHWVTQGDRGITYADALPKGTEVTAGSWWPEGYDGPPQISFSAEEATEMGLQLGDTMTVNVLGRDITAEITSFRNVSWEDAGIGFVLAMNQGALAGAPHSWISTVYAEEEAEAAILRDLATAYPNIAAIRIRDAIDQIIELVGGISAATRYGAFITLITGFLVLIGAAAAGERARTFEAAVLKTLGASRRRIIASFALRAAILGLGAGLVALGAGILGGWAVSVFVMETDYIVIWSNALLIVGGGVLASLLAGLAFAWRPLSEIGHSLARTSIAGQGMTDLGFFGYGSLVNPGTHDYANPRPASLHGWRRVWQGTNLREVAYLSVIPDQTATIQGVVAQVPDANWAALDQREAAYQRHDVSAAVGQGQTAVYQVKPAHLAPHGRHPILLSYLDVVAQGYLRVFGEAGVGHFFETTTGWGRPIQNDRDNPTYPRHQRLTSEERALVDDHLAAVMKKTE